ncbi:MAG: type I-E CRISPR-associated protein Cas7/Cse4/CasC [Dehalococcoidia bacterium]|nr:MAG: type I-E CRISPR-associated protein Cas7/Cse4/CasC [Dehalococcoidia bacterium]
MKLELHILQNFAPSNLNRDDTGSPKYCEFGGYRRARISSQCIKRAIRRDFGQQGLVPPDQLALRSKRFVDRIGEELAAHTGQPLELAKGVVEAALATLNFTLAGGGEKTEYLLYFGQQEIERIREFAQQHWDRLVVSAVAGQQKDKQAKGGKKDTKDEETKLLANELKKHLDGGRAADLALFGRMLADLPERNIDAAAQVAHAISTHEVTTQFDYYTAVDDLKPEETEGADMIGTVEFNSACYYRYANVDLDQLRSNLKNDWELAVNTVAAFVQASIEAIPTGKQNSFAAHNPPALIVALLRRRGSWSLANAFLKPVRPGRDGDLVCASARALDEHWKELVDLYGDPAEQRFVTGLASVRAYVPTLGDDRAWQPSCTELKERVREAVQAAYGG